MVLQVQGTTVSAASWEWHNHQSSGMNVELPCAPRLPNAYGWASPKGTLHCLMFCTMVGCNPGCAPSLHNKISGRAGSRRGPEVHWVNAGQFGSHSH